MDKTTIYVMTHKKFPEPEDPIYVPLHVGAALHDPLPYLSDATGSHISEKNPHYCELTGLYWMWKNDHESDIVGLCHYRRYFMDRDGNLLDEKFIRETLSRFDMIITPRLCLKNTTIEQHYCSNHNSEDLVQTACAIKKLCPEYLAEYERILSGNWEYFANMFICKKSLIDKYCEWLFAIMDEVEKNLDITDYDDYNQRVFGFISERLLTVWAVHNRLAVRENDIEEMSPRWELTDGAVKLAKQGNIEGLYTYLMSKKSLAMDIIEEKHDYHMRIQNLYALADSVFEKKGTGEIQALWRFAILRMYMGFNYPYEYFELIDKLWRQSDIGTLILGSEYGLHGIDLGLLTNQLSFCMTSLDISADRRILEYIYRISAPGRLKKMILILGEYSLYDVMTDTELGKSLFYGVVEPVINKEMKSRKWFFLPKGIVSDEEKSLIETACRKIVMEGGNFFNSRYTRDDNRDEKYKCLHWQEASGEERIKYARMRAEEHNKLSENTKMTPKLIEDLGKIAESCAKNGTELVVVIPPFTEEYENAVDPSMKERLFSELDALPYPLHLFDLNDKMWEGIFEDVDFYDMDHLNDAGAAKFTEIIKQF